MPKLSAFPKCYMDELCVTKTMTLFDWIELAGTLGVDGVEVYPGFFQSFEPRYLQRVKMQLVKDGLEVPMMCAWTDFTRSDDGVERAGNECGKTKIGVASEIGGYL